MERREAGKKWIGSVKDQSLFYPHHASEAEYERKEKQLQMGFDRVIYYREKRGENVVYDGSHGSFVATVKMMQITCE